MGPDVGGKVYWVMGLARSGCAAGALLRRHGARVIGLDDAAEEVVGRRWESEGLSNLAPRAFDQLSTGGLRPQNEPDGIIISPGIPPTHPALHCFDATVPVMGELELGSRFCAARQIAITGTNGKTTTTEWLAHLGRSAGLESHALGNVGRPLCAVADELSAEALAVLEVSSFQLESVSQFRPEVGMVLNLAPDHLDRYADLESYFAAKRILARLIPSDGAFITWTECSSAREWATIARRILFGKQSAGAQVYYRDDRLCASTEEFGRESEILLPTNELSLQSPPNLLNALAAAAAGLALRLPREAVARGLRDFPGLVHRHQLVARKDGIRFINDTKATNVHAVCTGLQGYGRPVVLIVGGSGKGEDYRPLREVMGSVRHVVLLGEEGPAIGTALTGAVATSRAASMDEAVSMAWDQSTQQPETDVDVLLSPACASFDQFANYGARGEAFTAAALKLGASVVAFDQENP
jgi:UDP-N-acetylmuramoylalanine--D-glutamate ligase